MPRERDLRRHRQHSGRRTQVTRLRVVDALLDAPSPVEQWVAEDLAAERRRHVEAAVVPLGPDANRHRDVVERLIDDGYDAQAGGDRGTKLGRDALRWDAEAVAAQGAVGHTVSALGHRSLGTRSGSTGQSLWVRRVSMTTGGRWRGAATHRPGPAAALAAADSYVP